MDNTNQQNQNNIAGDFTGMNPPLAPTPQAVPSTPIAINITPIEAQPVSTTMPGMDTGMTPPLAGAYQPDVKSSASPIFTPPTIELTPPTPQVETVGFTPLPTVTEPESLQQTELPKPKKGMSPVIMGVLIALFLGVAGGGVFVVSRATSGQAPVAPTAPESEPRAFEPTETENLNATDVIPDCSAMPNTAPYGNECRPTIIDANGNVMWAPEATNPNTSAPETTPEAPLP